MSAQQASHRKPVLEHRFAALDGIRSLAAIAVVLDHLQIVNAGWTGVDFFFVLSGFLITSILRRTRDDRSYYSEFWFKRVTRIMPPLVLCLLALVLFQSMSLRWAFICLLTGGDIAAAYMKPFLPAASPLWSLAVEEHFYFVWPFAVRLLPRRALLALLALLIVGEPILRAVYTFVGHPTWDIVYFLTQFRLDGLAMGALLAICFERPKQMDAIGNYSTVLTAVTAVVFVGLRVLLGLRFTRQGNTPLYNALSYFLVAMTAFWCIAFLQTHRTSWVTRALSWSPLVWVGQISYGLYLYHTIVLSLLLQHTTLSPPAIMLLTILISVVIAFASFRFIESPLIAWGRKKAEELRRRP